MQDQFYFGQLLQKQKTFNLKTDFLERKNPKFNQHQLQRVFQEDQRQIETPDSEFTEDNDKIDLFRQPIQDESKALDQIRVDFFER